MLRFGIYGARGRIGQELCSNIIENPLAELSAIYEYDGHPDIGQKYFDLVLISDIEDMLKTSDVIIDFSSPEGTMNLVDKNKLYKKALVIGTTGLDEKHEAKLKEASLLFPIVFSANYSVGINLLLKVLEDVGRVLSKHKDYDLEIVEAHHRYKKDSPSGTALKLAEAAATASGRNLKKDMVCGREGIIGERSIDEVGVFAVRGGDIIGEHTVSFTTLGERVELSHKAHSRRTFTKGALEAGFWLSKKENGLFSMREVLDL